MKTPARAPALMHPHVALVQRFYDAFDRHDGEAMADCYHADIIFSDPVFDVLKGERAADMWRMLAARAKDLSVQVSDVAADDRIGSARWIATYTFGKAQRKVRIGGRGPQRAERAGVDAERTRWREAPDRPSGRRVRNNIEARFEFKDGKIVRHDDSFSLWKWSSQALGPTGMLLGWTPMVQAKVRAEAKRGLDAYVAGRGRR